MSRQEAFQGQQFRAIQEAACVGRDLEEKLRQAEAIIAAMKGQRAIPTGGHGDSSPGRYIRRQMHRTEMSIVIPGDTRGKENSVMEHRTLGKQGPKISVIGFGSWAMGGGVWAGSWGPQDDQKSVESVHAALDNGVTWFDTAAV